MAAMRLDLDNLDDYGENISVTIAALHHDRRSRLTSRFSRPGPRERRLAILRR